MSEPSAKPDAGSAVSSRRRFWNHQWRMRLGQLGLDFAILAAAFLFAYLLRFEFDLSGQLHPLLIQLPYVMLIQLVFLSATGIYTFIWRYISLTEVHAFLYAAALSAVPVLVLRLTLPDSLYAWRVPISVIVIDSLLAFGGLLGVRVLRRVIYERYESPGTLAPEPVGARRPVLLIGAGRTGVMVAREIAQRRDLDLEIAGFIDDDPNKHGLVVQGVRVLGATEDLPRLTEELAIDHVILTVVEASRREIRRILGICERIGVRVRIVPGLYEIVGGKVSISRIRDIQIEDLLGRDPVALDAARVESFVAGKRVLVTGAGGSIGAELARQIARFGAAELLLVERSEGALFEIEQELLQETGTTRVRALLADIGDQRRMAELFADLRPQLIFHAAAHKHVPMMEQNPGEAIKNNVLATAQLGELAGQSGVEVFVLISTDKAVRPSSVMGASKRLAEMLVQQLDRRFATRFVAVRFGNVLGSTGSVVPIFRRQIAAGGPVTVTDPAATRYFMTIPEAVQLVLEAGAIGEGGDILMLDMGEPVKIVDLARDMISLSGLKPGEDVEIVFTGLRPGEKLHEDLATDKENVGATDHPKIKVVKLDRVDEDALDGAVERLGELVLAGDEAVLRGYLAELLSEARLAVSALTDQGFSFSS